MQLNYSDAITADRTILLSPLPKALPTTAPSPALASARTHRLPVMTRDGARGQKWEATAWLVLALSSLVAIVVCLGAL